MAIYLSDDFLDFSKSPIAQGLKRKGNRVGDYLSGDFFNLKKSQIVNFVKGILEERVE